MPDVIVLRGIEVFAHHGVFPEERKNGQTFVLDVEVEYDMGPASRSDDVEDALDYGALANAVARSVASDPVNLLETLCVRVLHAVFTFAPAQACTVTIHKPYAPMPVAVSDSAVSMRRERGDM